ncbi:MAG: amino acid ABC transporter permease [Candidatus Lokiarchaeota archaeon]|nr:amino acid ABC transporter permease [Candidatus Lokiarchaeota archaeon]
MIYQALPQPIEEFLNVLEYWDQLLAGFLITMWLYVLALIMGFFLGLLLATLRQYGGKILSRVATGYIEIIRGTPLLAQLLLIYFLPYSINTFLEARNLPYIPIGGWSFQVSFAILDKDITIILLNQRTFASILTLGLNSAAYQAEYLRGAMSSVGTGQLLAAQSLGMSKVAGIRHIVLPQALRRVIPAWSNEAAYLPKYTVVVYLIGVAELFAKAHYIVTQLFLTLTTYIVVALIFLVTITLISKGLDILHKRTAIPGL